MRGRPEHDFTGISSYPWFTVNLRCVSVFTSDQIKFQQRLKLQKDLHLEEGGIIERVLIGGLTTFGARFRLSHVSEPCVID